MVKEKYNIKIGKLFDTVRKKTSLQFKNNFITNNFQHSIYLTTKRKLKLR